MVPFAEVVLLTAMEYNREDKKKRKKTKKKKGKKTKNLQTTSLVVAPMDENVSIDEIKKGRGGGEERHTEEGQPCLGVIEEAATWYRKSKPKIRAPRGCGPDNISPAPRGRWWRVLA